ncbi:MAG: helix-turn-helix domain-containing protein [Oscillospiraceae bacterium]|jgi:transcriptional regulator with XRE-family HTH domain
MMTIDKIALRISKLRLQKNVSARNMSLSLGQNEGYINKIENKNSYPTMQSFFYICEYLGITPMQFFDFDDTCLTETNNLLEEMKKLDNKLTRLILDLVKEINKLKRK